MTDRELQKLKRSELLEIMLGLQNELDKTKEENEVLRSQVNDRKIALDKSGSIAEAALEINGVFIAAQKAADVYLENVKKMHDNQEKYYNDAISKAEIEAQNILMAAKRDAEALTNKTNTECNNKIAQTDMECNKKITETNEKCSERINETNLLCTKKIKETQEKCTAIASLDSKIATFFSDGNAGNASAAENNAT